MLDLLPTFTLGSKYLLPAKKVYSNTALLIIRMMIKYFPYIWKSSSLDLTFLMLLKVGLAEISLDKPKFWSYQSVFSISLS